MLNITSTPTRSFSRVDLKNGTYAILYSLSTATKITIRSAINNETLGDSPAVSYWNYGFFIPL